ncbi:outer membrane protein assembly factor BamB family protein [Rickettsia endosymbiont of Oedothorax gibbosus]|uniref:outer membrane protein assembly factor BamB family protein n=1 Tax=Rickettsia endosymbiont of Oedothorax gibbosus TaxID=931099 RepID=UPI00397C176E
MTKQLVTKQRLIIFLLPLMLTSCDLISKKIKNIVELTPRLSVETNEAIQVDSAKTDIFSPEMLQNNEYTVTKHKIIAEPIFKKAVVYTIDNKGNVSAFSMKDKAIIWSYNISTNKNDHYVGGGILYHNDKLYVTYGSRFLVVLDSKSGHEIIRKELPDIIRIKPVLINNHTIIVQTVTNQILAINTEKLNFVWQHEGIIEILSSSYHVAPIVQNGYVIVNYNSGQILALESNSGKILWTNDLSSQQEIGLPNFEAAFILCKPVVNNSHLYIANSAGKIIKLDIMTGNILWQIKAYDVQSMSLAGNSLFVTNNAGQVAAISTEFGKVKFVADLNDGKDIKKVKASSFLAPIIGKTTGEKEGEEKDWSLNIISAKGELYSFQSDINGNLSTTPVISKITKNIEYYGKTCCGTMYFTTDKKIILVD